MVAALHIGGFNVRADQGGKGGQILHGCLDPLAGAPLSFSAQPTVRRHEAHSAGAAASVLKALSVAVQADAVNVLGAANVFAPRPGHKLHAGLAFSQ